MGITFDTFQFLRYCKNSGVNFESTCQIGRQSCMFSSKKHGIKNGDFAEPLFCFLGAENVVSVDYSDYENASMIHDMNLPVAEDMKEKYSAVIDGGTLEHVFNYPVAIKNCMQMVKIGGHLILVTPANNLYGHGFYQFSPELFFSLLSEENGFAEAQILIQDDSLQWYRVKNPKEIKSRVDICCAKNTECLIRVVSRKKHPTPENLTVLQSDYVEVWKNTDNDNEKSIAGFGAKGWKIAVKQLVKKIIPGCVLDSIKKSMRRKMLYERVNVNNLTEI